MTITIDGTNYEAACQADAAKIVRKHARDAEKLRKENHRKEQQASLLAKAKACDLYERIAKGHECPPAWIAYTPSHDYGASLCRSNPPKPYSWTMYPEDKHVEVEMWYHQITHVVCNGSGFLWGFFAHDTYSKVDRFCTIAQFEGVHAIHECHGISLEWFRKPKRGDS